jgi:hypothetical protein
MADKVLYELAGEKFAMDALQAAEEMIRYSKQGGQEKNTIIKNIKAVLKQFRQIKRAGCSDLLPETKQRKPAIRMC